jgi:hypothetical protein
MQILDGHLDCDWLDWFSLIITVISNFSHLQRHLELE